MARVWGAIDNWHQTTVGLLLFGLLELSISYFFVSLAIDTGSLWAYGLALVFLAGVLQNAIRLVKVLIGGRKR